MVEDTKMVEEVEVPKVEEVKTEETAVAKEETAADEKKEEKTAEDMETEHVQKEVEGEEGEKAGPAEDKERTEVKKTIITEGTGDEMPIAGCYVEVHYTGTLAADGSKFDSSRDRNAPFEFVVGQGQVIKGWDEVVPTMKKGEKASVFIPHELGYGAQGAAPKIPGFADLVFEIELLSFRKNPEMMTVKEQEEAALVCKEEATVAFKAKEWEKACQMYQKGLQTLTMTQEKEESMDDGDFDRISKLYIALTSNICMCFIKLENWSGGYECAIDVLRRDNKHVKSYYRGGLCANNLKQFEYAKALLLDAEQISPEDTEIKRQLAIAKKGLAAQKKKDRKMFDKIQIPNSKISPAQKKKDRKMFNKFMEGGLYEETKDLVIKGPRLLKNMHRCWMSLSHGGKKIGKIVFAMYHDAVPKTVENFFNLCRGFAIRKKAGEAIEFNEESDKVIEFNDKNSGWWDEKSNKRTNDGTGAGGMLGMTISQKEADSKLEISSEDREKESREDRFGKGCFVKRNIVLEGDKKEEEYIFSYKGSSFHRVISSFMAQGGDIMNGNGTGSCSIYGDKFKDEDLNQDKCNRKGLLAMANSGPNTNGSQFFITFGAAPHLDGKHCVFGECVVGHHVVEYLNSPILTTAAQDVPEEPVVIDDCGAWHNDEWKALCESEDLEKKLNEEAEKELVELQERLNPNGAAEDGANDDAGECAEPAGGCCAAGSCSAEK